MSNKLTERLNAILPRIVSDEFLKSSGIGNEVAFYVFDYLPEDELHIRHHLDSLMEHLPKHKPGLKVKRINLLDLVIAHLEGRKLLARCYTMQKEKGDEHLLHALAPVLDAEKIADSFATTADPENHDLLLVDGVGSVWPLLRTHNLLNNLHAKMGKTPLIMFYPGCYDGQFLRLFGKVKSNPYYRAFRLVQ